MKKAQQLHWDAVNLKDSSVWLLFIKVNEPILSVTFNEKTNSLEVQCSAITYKAEGLPDEIRAEIKKGDFSVTVKSDWQKVFYDLPVLFSED